MGEDLAEEVVASAIQCLKTQARVDNMPGGAVSVSADAVAVALSYIDHLERRLRAATDAQMIGAAPDRAMSEEERMEKVAAFARDAFATAGGATKAIAMLADAMIAVIVLGFTPDVAEQALPDFAQYVLDQGKLVLSQRHYGTTVQ